MCAIVNHGASTYTNMLVDNDTVSSYNMAVLMMLPIIFCFAVFLTSYLLVFYHHLVMLPTEFNTLRL